MRSILARADSEDERGCCGKSTLPSAKVRATTTWYTQGWRIRQGSARAMFLMRRGEARAIYAGKRDEWCVLRLG